MNVIGQLGRVNDEAVALINWQGLNGCGLLHSLMMKES